MGTLLVSGNLFEVIARYDTKRSAIHNSSPLMLTDLLDYIDASPPTFGAVLLMDEALSNDHYENVSQLERVIRKLGGMSNGSDIPILILTRDPHWKRELSRLLAAHSSLQLEFHPYIRPSMTRILELLQKHGGGSRSTAASWFRSSGRSETEAPTPEPQTRIPRSARPSRMACPIASAKSG